MIIFSTVQNKKIILYILLILSKMINSIDNKLSMFEN